MTADTTALQERIARAIYRSDEDGMDRLSDDFGDLAPHWRRMYLMNAAAVLPIIAAEVQAAKAEALREAAEDLFYDGDQDVPIEGNALLHNRADEYETGDRA